jgi:hypothetical protein
MRPLLLATVPLLLGLVTRETASTPPATPHKPVEEARPVVESAIKDDRAPRGPIAAPVTQSAHSSDPALQGTDADLPRAMDAMELPIALPAKEPLQAALPEACVPTPLTPSALAEALWEGHIKTFSRPPHADRWACAWAHCAHEQARGEASHGNNLGHLTSRGNTARVCLRRLRERVARDPDRWEATDVRFRVFESPAEGAAAYWQILASSYYSVLVRCDEADARGAARRLAELGYFTGPEAPYLEGMAGLFVYARGVLIPRVIQADPERFTLPGAGRAAATEPRYGAPARDPRLRL